MATIIQLLCIISRSGANQQCYRRALTQLILQMQSSNRIWQPTSRSFGPAQAAEQAAYYAEALAATWPELRQHARQQARQLLTADCLYDWFNHRLQAKMLQRSLALKPTMRT